MMGVEGHLKFSRFGEKLTGPTGTRQLMDDLGKVVAHGTATKALGGGNPARIRAVELRFRQAIERLLAEPEAFERVVGCYDAPEGSLRFREALAQLFRREYGWDIGPRNVLLTNGSQTAFFLLFNLFGGKAKDGSQRKILLPLTPEYIGYSDVGLDEGLFVSRRPEIERIGVDLFKYHVDFDSLQVTEPLGAVCVSRPTNPSSNVLTVDELHRLAALARDQDVPFILDNAYGSPFPNILFGEGDPIWDEHVILSLSLSKLGLAGLRTGIVLANEAVISALASMNAIVSLSPSSFGTALVQELVESGEILTMSRRDIRPYYESRSQAALQWVRESLRGLPYRVHKPEGAFFFWLWFEGLPITSQQLYERLKRRGVIVVPGQHFFPGLDEDWDHKNECVRLNYSQDEKSVHEGIAIIGEELRSLDW